MYDNKHVIFLRTVVMKAGSAFHRCLFAMVICILLTGMMFGLV